MRGKYREYEREYLPPHLNEQVIINIRSMFFFIDLTTQRTLFTI